MKTVTGRSEVRLVSVRFTITEEPGRVSTPTPKGFRVGVCTVVLLSQTGGLFLDFVDIRQWVVGSGCFSTS